MEAKHELFWTQADFGYVKEVVNSIVNLCKPQHKVGCKAHVKLYLLPNEQGGSSLRCSRNERFCVAQHLYVDFRRFDEVASREKASHER